MAHYRFYPVADLQQDHIWEYTCTQWNETQAIKYINGLHDHLQALADKEKFWHRLPNKYLVPPDIKRQIYMSKYEYHTIFFRELSHQDIGIMSILHERMDIPVRLNKDLNKIKNMTK